MTTRSETIALEGPSETGLFGLRRGLFAFLLTIAAALVLAAAFLIGLSRAYEGRVLPGVSVAGVPVGGLDPASAEAVLGQRLPSLGTGHLRLVAGEATRTIAYRDLGREYDTAAMLHAALAVGRAGDPVGDTGEELRSLLYGTPLQPQMRYDRAALERHVQTAAATLEVAPRDAGVVAENGTFRVVPGADGRRVEHAPILAAAVAAVESTDPADREIRLSGVPVSPAITTAMAQTAAARAEAMAAHDLVLTAGSKRWTIPSSTVRDWLTVGRTPDGGYAPTVALDLVGSALTPVAKAVRRPGHDAGFSMKGAKVVAVRPGVAGRRLDTPATTARIKAALLSVAPAGSVAPIQLALADEAPRLSTKAAQALLPKMRLIPEGSWSTLYPVGEKNFFGKNITIPTAEIDGHLLLPGDWFDFWDVIGEVSRERGYGLGGAIINGRTEATGALAGGICSCSTTIFNAALRAGLEMGARRNHYYYIGRYPVGLDATVFKSSGTTQTMSFRNDTRYPIIIRGINKPGLVRFELYSVPTGRTVAFSAPVISHRQKAKDSIEYTDALPKGQTKRIEHPVDGFDVTLVRIVRDADGKVILRETYSSHYATITGVLLVGTGGATPTKPLPPPGDTVGG